MPVAIAATWTKAKERAEDLNPSAPQPSLKKVHERAKKAHAAAVQALETQKGSIRGLEVGTRQLEGTPWQRA